MQAGGRRLEQVAARLGRMSLSQSFTERRRSYRQLGHAVSADQASLWQQAGAAQAEQQQAAAAEQQQQQALAAGLGTAAVVLARGSSSEQQAAAERPQATIEPSPHSSSHWEWNALLRSGSGSAVPAPASAAEAEASDGQPPRSLSPLHMLQSAASGRLDAITKLQEAPMPPDLPASAPEAPLAEPPAPDAASTGLAAAAAAAVAVPAAAAAAAAAAASRASSMLSGSLGLSMLIPSAPAPPSVAAGAMVQPSPVHPLPTKQPSKLMQLLGKLRSDLPPGHMPLTAGRVELSGRALLPGGLGSPWLHLPLPRAKPARLLLRKDSLMVPVRSIRCHSMGRLAMAVQKLYSRDHPNPDAAAAARWRRRHAGGGV